MIKYLISKSATDKIRVVYLYSSEEWNTTLNGYTIERKHGQLNGKMQEAPVIVISKGKAGRTVKEQLVLQYNSELKKYLDKGYKVVESDPVSIEESKLIEILGNTKTDTHGFSKHMLAKPANKIPVEAINKVPYWYASMKIDGVRCAIYYHNNEICTASRGGGDYNCSMYQFITHPKLIEFFSKHPNIVLDGEIYKHGWSLQKISGEARKCETMNGSDDLEFYIYDVMLPNISFENRLSILKNIKSELNLEFNPSRVWEKEDLRMQIVPQERISGYDNIKKLHDQYVSEGWEGVVIRDPNKEYGFGKRTNAMIKIKEYRDDCFKVVGIEYGLRPIEDMVFILITKNGKTFKAKPFGDLQQKTEYYNNFNEKYLNKIGECKFFYYSDDGVPLQPNFKCFRDDLTEDDI